MPKQRRGGKGGGRHQRPGGEKKSGTKLEQNNNTPRYRLGGFGADRITQQFYAAMLVFFSVVLLALMISCRHGIVEAKNEATSIADAEPMAGIETPREPVEFGEPELEITESGSTEEVTDIEQIFVGAAFEVLQMIPHDKSAFTQGLAFHGGILYEGTGLYGQSELRQVSPIDGRVIQSQAISPKHFGEGIAHFKDKFGAERIIQITWKERLGFVYDATSFEVIREFTFDSMTGEGWGITYDATSDEFVVSDGSHWLFFWDADTLEEKRRVEVKLSRINERGTRERVEVRFLNELEYDRGHILANVWYQDVLLMINPQTGDVKKVYDFSGLYNDRIESADCFNGIALSDIEGQLFVTGKNWPHMYKIRLLS